MIFSIRDARRLIQPVSSLSSALEIWCEKAQRVVMKPVTAF